MSITRNQASGAYQRWTPPSFDDPVDDDEAQQSDTVDDATAAEATSTSDDGDAATPEHEAGEDTTPTEPEIHLPTAEEIETMYEQARAEGHAAGLDEGRAAGYEQGMKAAREQVQRLTEAVNTMDAALDALDGDIAEELAGLAVALAREMVGRCLNEDPVAVTDIVREALHHLPQGKARILLNPEDVTLIREQLDDVLDSGHHKLVEDASVARGGCHIETQAADIDATVHTRWLRVLRGIGREGPDWDATPDEEESGAAHTPDLSGNAKTPEPELDAEPETGSEPDPKPAAEPEPPRDA